MLTLKIFYLRKSIELLENERDELKNQIMVIDSKANQTKDEKIKDDLANMVENKEWLQRKIVIEKSKHEELNDKVYINIQANNIFENFRYECCKRICQH